MVPGPDPRAALRGFMALVLDMVRVDPDRRPSAEMLRWHRHLAATVGVLPETPRTNQDLLEGALRLSRAIQELPREREGTASTPPAAAEGAPAVP